MAVHAIGDRAVSEVLKAYAKLDQNGFLSQPALPSRIEHVQLISENDLVLFRRHGITASMQPVHAVSDMDMAERYWGSRCRMSYAWKSVLQSGGKLAFGSDAPVESPNPFHGLHAAISRQKILGEKTGGQPAWIADQIIALNDALAAYCTTPPQIGGFGDQCGQIKRGFSADLVILPANFPGDPMISIPDVLPCATMVNGEWVYKNDKIDIELTKSKSMRE